MKRGDALTLLVMLCACGGCNDAPPGPVAPRWPSPDLTRFDAAVQERLQVARERVVAEPEHGTAWGEYGQLLWTHGLHADALVCLDEARQLEPDAVRWTTLRAYVLRDVDPVAAADAFAEALAQDASHAEGFVKYGKLLRKLERNEEAQAAFAAALERDPGSFEALLGLGQIALDGRDFSGAIEQLLAAAEINHDDRRVHEALARSYFAAGDADRSQQHAARAQELSR